MKSRAQNKQIDCSRFDGTVDLRPLEKNGHRVRIHSDNPRRNKPVELIPIAVQGRTVVYMGERQLLRDFLNSLPNHHRRHLVVLTAREQMEVLDAALDFNALVRCFESCFPIFKGIKYRADPFARYRELTHKLEKVQRLGIDQPTLGKYFSNANQYRVERKLRFKSTLDANFYFGNPKAYQEVFKLFEEREDRAILAFDFNSMYPSCMCDSFLNPRSLRHWHPERPTKDVPGLNPGLYRVALKHSKSDWFMEHHPFEFTNKGLSSKFSLTKDDSIHCVAFKFELEFFRQFFETIEVYEGLISDSLITHPLKRRAKRLYSEKLHYRRQGNSLLEQMCQFELQTLHSASSQKRFRRCTFSSVSEAAERIPKQLGLEFPSDYSSEEILSALCKMKLIRLFGSIGHVEVSMPDARSRYNIHSLGTEVAARARIKVLSLLNDLRSWQHLEICYVNTDSVHVSIKANQLDSFLAYVRKSLSHQMGDLKLQCTASRGYWFDIGRYWLFDEKGNVIQYKNKLFNVNSKNPFNVYRKLKSAVRAPTFQYSESYNALLFDFFEYGKRLSSVPDDFVDHLDFERYTFPEIANLNVAGDIRTQEMLRAKHFKTSLFQRIATV